MADSIPKRVVDSDITAAKNVASNVTNLEDIKEVGEEVQYQIAQAQSPLSAISKSSWQLCKPAFSTVNASTNAKPKMPSSLWPF